MESYYLLNRWKLQNKKTFLDLGCGLAKELFTDFKIINIHQEIDYYEKQDGIADSYHYHFLIHKV